MGIRVAINGFGRIGRCVARMILAGDVPDLELVAVNDLTDPATLAYLFQFDSVHRRFRGDVAHEGESLVIAGRRIPVLATKDPAKLPWRDMEVDVVLECTGHFRSRDAAGQHLGAGARRVIISAPPQGDVDATFVPGVNDRGFDTSKHFVVSNASCTTNCLATVVKVLDERFGVVKGQMLTVHSYTNDQSLVDEPHKGDLRRGRTAGLSMIPTSSGVSKALAQVLPQMTGKFSGTAVRVPTADVSITYVSALVSRNTTAEEVNDAFRAAANGPMRGTLAIEDRPLVSVDYIGDMHSAIVDSELTEVVAGDLVQVQAWYDNEWGFSARMTDLARLVGAR